MVDGPRVRWMMSSSLNWVRKRVVEDPGVRVRKDCSNDGMRYGMDSECLSKSMC